MHKGYARLLALFGSMLVSTTSIGVAQQLTLKAVLEKDLYFESEPIYLLLDLSNSGSDTAWVLPYELAYNNLTVSILRDGRVHVPEQGLIADYSVPRGWRGVPIAGGAHVFETIVLQVWWGEDPIPGSQLFRRRLAPGHYELRAQFNAHQGLHTAPTLIESGPVSFVVRPRSPSEDAIVEQVEAIRAMPWNLAQRGQSVHALVAWVDSRAAQNANDPFLAYLLHYGVITTAAVGVSPSPEEAVRLRRLRATVAEAQLTSPASAVVTEAMVDDSLALKALASGGLGTPGSAVASFRLARIRAQKRPR